MEKYTNEEIEEIAKKIRLKCLDMVYHAGSGHLGGSFSLAEIFAVLFFESSNIKDFLEDKENIQRDKVVMSKGHASPVLYATLSELGLIEDDELLKFRQVDGILEGHPKRDKEKLIEYSAGSLGQGLSYAVGVALARKYETVETGIESGKVFCVIGDGEMQEGQIWEALMSASNFKLSNLIVILDRNNVQLDGNVKDIMDIGQIEYKLLSFGFRTIEIDGHNINQIKNAILIAIKEKDLPICIIANTVKGKGVSFMENTHIWHGKAPNEEEYKRAKGELEKNV